jgi:hypothetical protein
MKRDIGDEIMLGCGRFSVVFVILLLVPVPGRLFSSAWMLIA